MATKKRETKIQMTLEEARQAAQETGMKLGAYKRKFRIEIVAETPPSRATLNLTDGMNLIRDHSESSRNRG